MSYLSWNAMNSCDNGSDFQAIALNTNYRFNTHKGRVNWSQIEKLSIDRLIDDHDVAQLGNNISNVVSLDIQSESIVRTLSSNFVKIFKLSQLTIDFLLHCKRHLSQQQHLLKVDLEKVNRKLMNVKKENTELKKIIHWNKWRPLGACADKGSQDNTNAVMCEICGKLFQFESYLIMHYNRKHPGVRFPMQKSDPGMQNYYKISKEEYEKHLRTMENTWRKQFQELDKKYQHEIKKLQEELKLTMEQNKISCQKMIRDEITKVTEDKRIREDQKYEEQSSSPREMDQYPGVHINVLGEFFKTQTLCRQQSIYNFAQSTKDIVQSISEDETNLKISVIDDANNGDGLLMKDMNRNDIDFEPVRIKKSEETIVKTCNIEKKVKGFRDGVVKSTFSKDIYSSPECHDICVSNYQNLVENTNQNEEFNKQKFEDIKMNEIDREGESYPFFANMNTKVFDFNRETGKKNGLFYNEDFKRDISNLVAIKPGSMEKMLDKTFRMSDKPFRYNNHRLKNILTENQAKSEYINNVHNLNSNVESIQNNRDGEKLLNKIFEQRTAILNSKDQEPRVDVIYSDIKEDPSEAIPSRKNDNHENTYPIKHSAKYFGDISSLEKSIQKVSKTFTNSSIETIDKLIAVINADSEYDYEVMDTSNSDSSKSDSPNVTFPISHVTGVADETIDEFAEYSGGTQITVTRAEYEILAKDLSTIVEESEAEDSPSQSVNADGRAMNQLRNLNSSDDSSILAGSTEIQPNRQDTSKKVTGINLAPTMLREVNATDDNNLVDDGNLRDRRRRVALVYWNGELRPTWDSLEELNSDYILKGSPSNRPSSAIYTAPTTAKGVQNTNVKGKTKRKPPKDESLITTITENQTNSISSKEGRLKIKVVLQDRKGDQSRNEENEKDRKDERLIVEGNIKESTGDHLTVKEDIKRSTKEHLTVKEDIKASTGENSTVKEDKEAFASKEERSTVIDNRKSGKKGKLICEKYLIDTHVDLNPSDNNRLIVKESVIDRFEHVMHSLSLNPEWITLPDKTFKQKMQIFQRDSLLKRKTFKNYISIKSNIKRKIDTILKEKLRLTEKRENISNTFFNEETEPRHNDDETTISSLKIEDGNKHNVNISGENISQSENFEESPKIRKFINRRLIDLLSEDILKRTPDDVSMRLPNTNGHALESFKNNPIDCIVIETPEFDVMSISNITGRLDSEKVSETSEWETLSTSEEEEEVITENNNNKQTSLGTREINQLNSECKDDNKNVPIISNEFCNVSASKQALESGLTIHIQSNTEDAANDILNREPANLQTNKFTSMHSLGKTYIRGYNIFGKPKKIAALKQLKISTIKNTDKSKSSDLTDTDGTDKRKDARSQTSSLKESSQNTLISHSSKESTSQDDEKRTKDIQQDIFIALHNSISTTSSTSESNFLMKHLKQFQPKENSQESQIYNVVYTNNSRLDCGDVRSPLAPKNPSFMKDSSININKFTCSNIGTDANNILRRECDYLQTNDLKNNLETFRKSQSPLSLQPQDVGIITHLVPNESENVKKTQDLPLQHNVGTIRSITKAIQDGGEGTNSSLELDDFHEKNNIGL